MTIADYMDDLSILLAYLQERRVELQRDFEGVDELMQQAEIVAHGTNTDLGEQIRSSYAAAQQAMHDGMRQLQEAIDDLDYTIRNL